MEGGNINLGCSDFLSNVYSSFNNLHDSALFTDVTLVSDDNKQIQAHKLILSVGSEYFRDILSDKSHPHPMLCLDGVSSEDLARIIKYLYVGEVSVPQSSLQKFLKIAKKLKCFGLNEDGPQRPEVEKGEREHFDNEISYIVETNIVNLCDDRDRDVKVKAELTNDPSTNINEERKNRMNEDGSQAPEVEKIVREYFENEIPHIIRNEKVREPVDNKEKETCNVEQENNEQVHVQADDPDIICEISTDVNPNWQSDWQSKVPKSFPEFCRINGKQTSKDQLYELLKEHYYQKENRLNQCANCEYSTKNLGHMIEHTQRHIQNLEVKCDICGKIFGRTHVLRDHKRRSHPKSALKIFMLDPRAIDLNNEEEPEEDEGVKYACDQCDYQATRQDNLTRHIHYV